MAIEEFSEVVVEVRSLETDLLTQVKLNLSWLKLTQEKSRFSDSFMSYNLVRKTSLDLTSVDFRGFHI